MNCKICGNSENNKLYQIKEMFFGYRDKFEYFECQKCGCLQILNIPHNLYKYYPNDYYSYKKNFSRNIKRYFGKKRDEYVIFKKGLFGNIINHIAPSVYFEKMARANLEFDINTEILDVGCGSGLMLHSFSDIGFTKLTGVDPFIEDDIINGYVKIYKKYIHELPANSIYDLIIFNHSFEHINDQLETLVKVSEILHDKGVCIISMPMKTNYIWKKYGTYWVQIDAPRHFILHTLKSFELLVKKSGLSIRDFYFDSGGFQFYASEQYMRNIHLKSGNSYYINPKRSIFTSKQIKNFNSKAKELNRKNEGDTATFYLVKT